MTQAQFIAKLQARGFGTGLDAAQWAQVAEDALAMYSDQRPVYVLGTIAVTAGVESYSLPTGGRVCLGISPQVAMEDLWAAITNTLGTFPFLGDSDVLINFHEPSQADILRGQMEAWSRQFGSRWEQFKPWDQVHLRPLPTEDATLAILYTTDVATIDLVPAGDSALILKAGEALACRTRARVLSEEETASGAGENVRLGPFEHSTDLRKVRLLELLLKQATEAEADFLGSAHIKVGARRG